MKTPYLANPPSLIAHPSSLIPRPFYYLPLVLAVALPLPAAEIHLRPQCSPHSAVVRLGDLADIYSGDTRETAALAAVELFPAPVAGQQRFLRVQELQDLLMLRGVNLAHQELSGATQIVVGGSSNRDVAAPATLSSAEIHKQAPLSRPPVVMATHALSKGVVIRASDVELASANLSGAEADSIGSVEDVVGYEALHAISPGRPIGSGDVRAPLLVRRNDVVTVYARSPGVCIKTVARARQDGSQGELIEVESIQDRKPYMARVSGYQEAEVFARATQAVEPTASRSLLLGR